MLPALLAALFAGWVAPASAAMSRGFQRVLDAVVRIDVREVAFEAGAKRFASSIGSGVIFSADGLVLTNAHVVGPRAVEINVTLASLERVGGPRGLRLQRLGHRVQAPLRILECAFRPS